MKQITYFVNWITKRIFGYKTDRKFPRIPGHQLVKIRDGSGRYELAFIRDISQGGLLFYSERHIAEGTQVDLEINLRGCPFIVNAKAELCRTRAMNTKDRFEIGVEFTDIDRKGLDFIRKMSSDTGANESERDN